MVIQLYSSATRPLFLIESMAKVTNFQYLIPWKNFLIALSFHLGIKSKTPSPISELLMDKDTKLAIIARSTKSYHLHYSHEGQKHHLCLPNNS